MRISVVICTCNGENYIEEQIESILNQTISPDEVILSDDCSVDDTVWKAEKILKDSEIEYKLLKNEQRLGCVKNFEHASKVATGDVIFFADQDDYWESRKIETIRSYFEDEDVWIVFHDAKLVDANLNVKTNSWFAEIGLDVRKFNHGDYSELLLKNYIQGAAMAFRRCLVEKSLPFSEYSYHDEWLGLMALCNQKKMIALPDTLIKYRQWGGNTLGGNRRGILFFFNKLLDKHKFQQENCEEILRRCNLFNDLCSRNPLNGYNDSFYRAVVGINYRMAHVCQERKMPNVFCYRLFYPGSKWWVPYLKDFISYI